MIGGIIGATWGILGVQCLLLFAIYRLTPIVLDLLSHTLRLQDWIAIAVSVTAMLYAEGYKGFQQSFSPRVAARCLYLYQHPTFIRILLAPLFCMGWFHSPRRRQISIALLTLMIVLLIVTVQQLTQPWRGIIDTGVLFGLAWGVIATTLYIYSAFTSEGFTHSAEIPSL